MSRYTNVVEDVWQCNDCGAHADKPENVKHHDTCVPGESQKWEEFYNKANEEEEDWRASEWHDEEV